MADSATTSIEIDTELLDQLRRADPGKSDRELIEDLARMWLDFRVIRRLQERFGLSEEEAMSAGTDAVRASRRL